MPQYMPLSVCWPLACVFWFLFSFFFFGELPFLQCLFFVCLLFVRAFDCLLCVALTLFLLCFVSAFFCLVHLASLTCAPHFPPLAPSGCYCRLTVRLAQVAHVSPQNCQNCYCFVVGLALLFPFFLGRKFMLTVLHWKCINLCVYTMCRHSLSRPEGQTWMGVGEEWHMCLLSTFYGLCPCPCSWLDTPYSSIVRSRHVLFTYSLCVFI